MLFIRVFIRVLSFFAYRAVRRWKIHEYLSKEDLKKLTKKWITVRICQLLPPSEEKNELLRGVGFKIGKNVFISPDVILDPVYPEMITIEDGVFIGWGARVFSHMITPEGLTAGQVHIGKNAFIGGFTTIRPFVNVGENAYIGSDSLVTKDIPDGAKAYGIPARVKGKVMDISEMFD